MKILKRYNQLYEDIEIPTAKGSILRFINDFCILMSMDDDNYYTIKLGKVLSNPFDFDFDFEIEKKVYPISSNLHYYNNYTLWQIFDKVDDNIINDLKNLGVDLNQNKVYKKYIIDRNLEKFNI